MADRKQLLFDLYSWQYAKRADWFTIRLFTFIARADAKNQQKLALGFPDEVAMMKEWKTIGPSVFLEDDQLAEKVREAGDLP